MALTCFMIIIIFFNMTMIICQDVAVERGIIIMLRNLISTRSALEVSVTQPMFVIVQFDVKDSQKYFEHYGSKMSSVAAKFGGEFLAASSEVVAKEGMSSGNFTAILRFPSEEAAIAMYESPEYAPLKTKRLEELTNGGNVIYVPGIETASRK